MEAGAPPCSDLSSACWMTKTGVCAFGCSDIFRASTPTEVFASMLKFMPLTTCVNALCTWWSIASITFAHVMELLAEHDILSFLRENAARRWMRELGLISLSAAGVQPPSSVGEGAAAVDFTSVQLEAAMHSDAFQIGLSAGHEQPTLHISMHIGFGSSQVRSHGLPQSVQTLPPEQTGSAANASASSASSSSMRLLVSLAIDMPSDGNARVASVMRSVLVQTCS
mmetsp:Transcript_10823/g.25993  ORF Transcript_10823/g.25993 Transcript_10823/m.25993 type:complete len:225 (+) Transcript_10823:729-1403(+)